MRTIILFFLAVLLGLPGMAQTNFRSITYDEAIAAAKAENKLVFIDFYTDWCGPCKRMTKEVFPQKEVGDYMNQKFICIKLNAEKEGKELADLYKVAAYPTFIAIDADKNIVLTKVGGGDAKEFIADIDRMLDPERSPERMKARYEGGERTPKLIESYTAYLMSEIHNRHDGEELLDQVYKIIHDYFNGLTDTEKLAHENLFVYTDHLRSVDDEIAQYMVTHRNDFDEQSQKEINETIDKLYYMEMYNYLSGEKKYEATTYQALKQQINALGLEAEKYAPCFRLIEGYAQGDKNAYLKLCKEIYPSLDKNLRSIFINCFAQWFEGQDDGQRYQASRFLRDLLPDMETNDLPFAAYQIVQLESSNSSH